MYPNGHSNYELLIKSDLYGQLVYHNSRNNWVGLKSPPTIITSPYQMKRGRTVG